MEWSTFAGVTAALLTAAGLPWLGKQIITRLMDVVSVRDAERFKAQLEAQRSAMAQDREDHRQAFEHQAQLTLKRVDADIQIAVHLAQTRNDWVVQRRFEAMETLRNTLLTMDNYLAWATEAARTTDNEQFMDRLEKLSGVRDASERFFEAANVARLWLPGDTILATYEAANAFMDTFSMAKAEISARLRHAEAAPEATEEALGPLPPERTEVLAAIHKSHRKMGETIVMVENHMRVTLGEIENVD